MPYNDYICARCGKHFQDIDAWRDYCSLKNCPTKYKEDVTNEDRRNARDEILNTLPPRRHISNWVLVIFLILVALFLTGLVYGVIALIRWLV
jgi:DNA-directed RNA polymerase subunit RPC12/RpoP